MTTEKTPSQRGHSAGLFDVRLVIAALFFIYGVVLTVLGAGTVGPAELAKSANVNINLWSGIAMIVFAAVFALWMRLRPIIVPDDPDTASSESG